MPLCSRAARIALPIFGLLLAVASGRAAPFVDAAGRHVNLPQQIGRVMPADQAAAVLIFALAPDKLVGWSRPLSPAQRAYLPAKYARLPVVGEFAGGNRTVAVGAWHPDLIIGIGVGAPQEAALLDRISTQTRVPAIVLNGSIQETPATLRSIGLLLGVGDHRLDVASYAFHAIQGLRGKLLIQSPDERPRVYFGLGYNGLTTGLAGSLATAVIDQAGAINVAAALGQGEVTQISPRQLLAWNPDIVIAQERSFFSALQHESQWRGLAAVRGKRVYLAPSQPFGWIGDPAGVNRMVGLFWLSDLFYPNVLEEDLRTNVRDFYQTYYGIKLTDRQLDALLRPAVPPALLAPGTTTVSLFQAEPAPEPELAPRPLPGGPALPLRPPGRGGLPANPPTGSGGPQQ